MGDGKEGVDKCGMLAGHEPTAAVMSEIRPPPSPFGGPGGLPGERPPADATDAELDAYAEWWFNRSLEHFEANTARVRAGTRKRRKLSDYTAKNCEEAYGGNPS